MNIDAPRGLLRYFDELPDPRMDRTARDMGDFGNQLVRRAKEVEGFAKFDPRRGTANG